MQYEAKVLSTRLLLERRALDLDQTELARRAGISNGYISDIERGKVSNVGIEVIFSLAKSLGVAPGYLVGLSDDPLQNISDQADEFDALTQEFLSIFQQLSDDKKKTLLDLARMLRSADEPRIIGA